MKFQYFFFRLIVVFAILFQVAQTNVQSGGGGGGDTSSSSNDTAHHEIPSGFEGNVIVGFIASLIFLFIGLSLPLCCFFCVSCRIFRICLKKREEYHSSIGEIAQTIGKGITEPCESENHFKSLRSAWKPLEYCCDGNFVSYLEKLSGWGSVILVGFLTIHSLYFVSYVYGDTTRMKEITGTSIWFQDFSDYSSAEEIYIDTVRSEYRNLITATYAINYSIFSFGVTTICVYVFFWFVLICFLPQHHHHHHKDHGEEEGEKGEKEEGEGEGEDEDEGEIEINNPVKVEDYDDEDEDSEDDIEGDSDEDGITNIDLPNKVSEDDSEKPISITIDDYSSDSDTSDGVEHEYADGGRVVIYND